MPHPFSPPGFRLGLFITQHNDGLIHALTATSFFSQTAAPAGQLWAALLNDEKYLDWYLATNRHRLTKTYDYMKAFLRHHQIPYVPSNAGHFLLVDLRNFIKPADDGVETRKIAEAKLSSLFITNGVYVAPGAQYHHPVPGFFRLTFSIEPVALVVGLERIEKTLGLEPWIGKQKPVEFEA